MSLQPSPQRKNLLIWLLKMALLIASLYVIYHQVIVKDNFLQTMNEYAALLNNRNAMLIILVLLAMMVLNWLIEAVKWKILVSKIQHVSLPRSFKAILSGITVSFFTPNRIGEYAGRVLHVDYNSRIKAVLATVVGSMNQLLVTIITGTIAFLFTLRSVFADERIVFAGIASLSVLGMVALSVVYFNISYFYDFLKRFKWLKRLDEYIKVFSYYHNHELSIVTFLSAFRYIVFTLQYILLLSLLGVDIDFWNAYRLILLIFLVMAVIPTFILTELSVRGSVALYFMQSYSDNATGIVAASFSLWFINLAIPAVAGAFFLLFVKFTRWNV